MTPNWENISLRIFVILFKNHLSESSAIEIFVMNRVPGQLFYGGPVVYGACHYVASLEHLCSDWLKSAY